MEDLHLIVGLGNPGRRYAANRHNVGFQIVDRLGAAHGLRFTRRQGNALVGLYLRAFQFGYPPAFRNRRHQHGYHGYQRRTSFHFAYDAYSQ